MGKPWGIKSQLTKKDHKLIHIGYEYDRWQKLKTKIGVDSDLDLLTMLLDSYIKSHVPDFCDPNTKTLPVTNSYTFGASITYSTEPETLKSADETLKSTDTNVYIATKVKHKPDIYIAAEGTVAEETAAEETDSSSEIGEAIKSITDIYQDGQIYTSSVNMENSKKLKNGKRPRNVDTNRKKRRKRAPDISREDQVDNVDSPADFIYIDNCEEESDNVIAPPKERTNYSHAQLRDAYKAVMEEGLSTRRAAIKFQVPESTLRNRVDHKVSLEYIGRGSEPLLSKFHEGRIVAHINELASVGYLYTKTVIAAIATDYAVHLGKKDRTLDKNFSTQWFKRFRMRWPNLQFTKPGNVAEIKARNSSPECINKYFKQLKHIFTQYNLKDSPHLIYNIQEQVINSRSKSITIIGAGNAAGSHIPPMLIFPGQQIVPEVIEGESAGSKGTLTPTMVSGSSNSEAFSSYFKNHFLKKVQGRNSSDPLLVLYDGHKSHVAIDLIDWAKDNNIILFVLPPYCSHVSQTMPDWCFGPLQTKYTEECLEFTPSNNQTVTFQDICGLACKAYWAVVSEENTERAFERAGIYPLKSAGELIESLGEFDFPEPAAENIVIKNTLKGQFPVISLAEERVAEERVAEETVAEEMVAEETVYLLDNSAEIDEAIQSITGDFYQDGQLYSVNTDNAETLNAKTLKNGKRPRNVEKTRKRKRKGVPDPSRENKVGSGDLPADIVYIDSCEGESDNFVAPPKKRMNYSHTQLVDAYNAVMEEGLSTRRAAIKFQIPESTLRKRVDHKIPLDYINKGSEPLLSKFHEGRLVAHINELASVGYSYNRTEIAAIATDYAVHLGKKDRTLDKGFSMQWYKRFSARWPHLQVAKPTNVAEIKARYTSPECINNYFKQLEDIFTQLNLRDSPHLIYNVEEQVINSRNKSITIIGAGNAAGSHIPPLLIFPGKQKVPELIEGESAGSKGTPTMVTGLSNSDAFSSYLKNHFLKRIRGRNSSDPLLVLYDGHQSHVGIDLIDWAKDNNIVLFVLPPYCSNVSEAMPDWCFGPLQTKYNEEYLKFSPFNDRTVTFQDICGLVCKAYWAVVSETNAKRAFERAGIYPLKSAAEVLESFVEVEVPESAAKTVVKNILKGQFPVLSLALDKS